jgi:hypothetical protein
MKRVAFVLVTQNQDRPDHMHMVALYTVWYNYVKQHKSLKGLSPYCRQPLLGADGYYLIHK